MRPIAKLAAVCGIAALSSACIVVANPPPQAEPGATAPAPGAAAAQTVAQPSANGRPRNLQAGAAEAYWVWRDDNGGWHLRSTTAKVEHRFSGRISGHGKVEITGVHAARTERNDTVKLVDNNISFDFTTAANEDGLDFTIPGNACVDFDLQIDAKYKPDHIVVGANEQRPKNARFTACP